jgi:hypothetical protein
MHSPDLSVFVWGVVVGVFLVVFACSHLIVVGVCGSLWRVACAPPVSSATPVATPVVGVVMVLWVGLVVCVTSCEGHMVDALASRADEGRRSLR